MGRTPLEETSYLPEIGSGPQIEVLLRLRLRKAIEVLKSMVDPPELNLVVRLNQLSSRQIESIRAATLNQPYEKWCLWIIDPGDEAPTIMRSLLVAGVADSRIKIVPANNEPEHPDLPFLSADSRTSYLAILPEKEIMPPDWLVSWSLEIRGMPIPFPLGTSSGFPAKLMVKTTGGKWQSWRENSTYDKESDHEHTLLVIGDHTRQVDIRSFLVSFLRKWRISNQCQIKLIFTGENFLCNQVDEFDHDILVLSEYPDTGERRCMLESLLSKRPRLVFSTLVAEGHLLEELWPLSIPVVTYLDEGHPRNSDKTSVSLSEAVVRCSDHYIVTSEATAKSILVDYGVKDTSISVVHRSGRESSPIAVQAESAFSGQVVTLLQLYLSSSLTIDSIWTSSEPLLSVVVPNYNHSQYLPKRLKSILDQEIKNIEILLLDDASSDGSVRILEEFAASDPRAKLIINGTNSGSTFRQWKMALALAKGRYVWIAESDDSAEPGLVSNLIELLEQNSDLSLAYTQSRKIDEFGNFIGSPLEWTNDISRTRWTRDYEASGLEEIKTALSIKNTIPNASAVVFRNFTGIENLVDTDVRYCGDWRFWIRLCERGGVAFSARPRNLWRQNTSNARNRPDGELEWSEGRSIIEEAARILSCSDLETQALVSSFREKCIPSLAISHEQPRSEASSGSWPKQ